jgi:hypothetical protein
MNRHIANPDLARASILIRGDPPNEELRSLRRGHNFWSSSRMCHASNDPIKDTRKLKLDAKKDRCCTDLLSVRARYRTMTVFGVGRVNEFALSGFGQRTISMFDQWLV